MKLKGVNSSTRKTKALIKRTFAELMEEKKLIDNITVTELVKRADITRGAFYSHYDNIYDVAEEFEEEIIEVAFQNIKELTTSEEAFVYFDNMYIYIKNNEDVYRKLIMSDAPIIFMKRLNTKVNKSLKNVLNKDNDIDLEMKINFFADGIVNLLIKYLKNEINVSLDKLNEFTKNTYKELFIKKDS